MKRSVLHFKDVDAFKVEFLGFENVASPKEIKKEFGHQTGELYFWGTPRYCSFTDTFIIYSDHNVVRTLKVGQVITKEHRDRVVRILKAAGDRLAKLKISHPVVYKIII